MPDEAAEIRRHMEITPPSDHALSVRDTGFQSPYTAEQIETALWELVIAGGNSEKARQALAAAWGEADTPSAKTLRTWRSGPYRNRYHEIAQGKAREIEELVAQKNMELAAQASSIEESAMREIAARISGVDAVEASLILKNVSMAKGANIANANVLRGRSGAQMQAKSMNQLAAALERLGVAQVVEGDAEEISDAALVPES